MEHISHISPILPVRNMDKSLDFYRKLGFQPEFLWQEPVTYAVLSANERSSIHLSLLTPEDRDRKTKSILYIFVHNVDAFYQECLENEIPIEVKLDDRDYQMRDFEVLDPDGNLLTFGQGIEQ